MNVIEKQMDINLQPYRGHNSTTYTGRVQGIEVRAILDLDSLDRDNDTHINIIIPAGTTSITPSFYLGLFYNSIKRLGSVDSFNKKYTFIFADENEETISRLKANISNSERQARNELIHKTGLGILK